MIGRVLRTGVVLLASLGVTAGCGSSDRPQELPVGDVQPCKLISSAALRALPTASGPHLVKDVVEGGDLDGSTCKYPLGSDDGSTDADNEVAISTVTNHGIDWQVDGPHEHRSVADVSDVRGFHTVRVWRGDDKPDENDQCELYVDVAEGQALRVQVDESFDDGQPPTCETATWFATEAVKGLAAA